jgi:CO/xanthine dehydrogenase Mo-binding subunit
MEEKMTQAQQVDRKLSPAKGFWLRNREVLKKEFSIIGTPVPRIESSVKVTGEARYAADLKFPGMLYGKILRSPYAHAKIISIDTSKAEKLPGVVAVVTGKDTIGARYGLWRLREETMDEQGLATDKVRYVGDEVAAVAAVDEDTAIEALGLIDVTYDVLPALLTPEDACKDGAPEIQPARTAPLRFMKASKTTSALIAALRWVMLIRPGMNVML